MSIPHPLKLSFACKISSLYDKDKNILAKSKEVEEVLTETIIMNFFYIYELTLQKSEELKEFQQMTLKYNVTLQGV